MWKLSVVTETQAGKGSHSTRQQSCGISEPSVFSSLMTDCKPRRLQSRGTGEKRQETDNVERTRGGQRPGEKERGRQKQ